MKATNKATNKPLKKVQQKENKSDFVSALMVISLLLLPIVCILASFNQ